MSRDYDVVIIGSGPSGFSCAMQASKFDKKVLVVEAHEKFLGGTWLNTGTVPSKALREKASTIYRFIDQFGDEENRQPYERFKMKDLLEYKDEILENENKMVKQDLIKNQVDTARGYGRLIDKNTVEIEGHSGTTEQVTADYLLVSTGSRPSIPDNIEIDHDKILDNQSILELTHIPRRLIVVGAGVNAIEYATIFSALGSKVTILDEESRFLPFLDYEIKDQLHKVLKNRRISLYKNVDIQSVDYNPLRTSTEVRFKVRGNDELKVLETEHVLYLGQRTPNTDNIGLEKVGVETTDTGYIAVSNNFKTNINTIYAAGDVTGYPNLASASFSQGRLAACSMFEIPSLDKPPDIPYGIYSIPEIASIGMTEEEAKNQGLDVTVGRAYFEHVTQAIISSRTEGLLKLVFDSNNLRLYGVQALGENATEMIHLGQAVIAFEGDIRYFIQHVLNYPTYTDAYKTAAFNGINRVYKAGAKYKNILED